jgi:thioredoxin-like negative regulator of GroEL
VRSEDLEFTEEAPTIALDHGLREGIAKAHRRAQAAGWAWFREGQYRRAARAFESATALEPKNMEDRIGELFCHVSMGATRTAIAILGELNRRHADLFRHSLPLARAYGDAAEAQQVRIRLRLQVNAAGNVPDLEALYALVLWFLGEREEAHLAVVNIVRVYPHTAYAEWPSRMRAAQNALSVEKDRP